MSKVSDRTYRQLQLLASSLKNNSNYLAGVLANYQKFERLSDAELTQVLGVTPLSFARLAISKKPSTDSPDFTREVMQISNYAGSDPAILAHIIRQVESLEVYQALQDRKSETPTASHPGRIQAGLLATARDQIDQEPDNGEDASEDKDENQEGGNELVDE